MKNVTKAYGFMALVSIMHGGIMLQIQLLPWHKTQQNP